MWAALPFPSADTLRLYRQAQQLLKRLWQPGIAYQKHGVMLTELSPRQHSQPSLLDGAEPARQEALMAHEQSLSFVTLCDTLGRAAPGAGALKDSDGPPPGRAAAGRRRE